MLRVLGLAVQRDAGAERGVCLNPPGIPEIQDSFPDPVRLKQIHAVLRLFLDDDVVFQSDKFLLEKAVRDGRAGRAAQGDTGFPVRGVFLVRPRTGEAERGQLVIETYLRYQHLRAISAGFAEGDLFLHSDMHGHFPAAQCRRRKQGFEPVHSFLLPPGKKLTKGWFFCRFWSHCDRKRGVFHSKSRFMRWKTPLSPVKAAGPHQTAECLVRVTCNLLSAYFRQFTISQIRIGFR